MAKEFAKIAVAGMHSRFFRGERRRRGLLPSCRDLARELSRSRLRNPLFVSNPVAFEAGQFGLIGHHAVAKQSLTTKRQGHQAGDPRNPTNWYIGSGSATELLAAMVLAGKVKFACDGELMVHRSAGPVRWPRCSERWTG